MNADRSSPGTDGLRDAYRRATATLDERPDAAVRQAVLAEAEAEAANAAAGRPATSTNPFGRHRWPLSMAAALVVAMMVGAVVQRATDEEPDRIVGTTAMRDRARPLPIPDAPDRPASRSVDGSPPTPPTASTARPPAPSAAVSAAPLPSVPPHQRAVRSVPPTGDGTARDADRARDPVGEATPEQAHDAGPPATAPAPAPAPTGLAKAANEAAAANAAPGPAAAVAAADPGPTQTRSREAASRTDTQRLVAARSGRGDPPVAAQADARVAAQVDGRVDAKREPATPEAWVARIARLRGAGRTDAAERELVALRKRFPDFVVPAAALGGPGDR